jgi:hypothetical protein
VGRLTWAGVSRPCAHTNKLRESRAVSHERSRIWLICLLSGGCFGGPISDFPKNSSGNESGGAATPDDNGDGTQVDPGMDEEPAPPSFPDAGSPVFGDGDGDGTAAPGMLLDGGTEDAASESCGANDAGMCQGSFCGTSRLDLGTQSAPGGACATDTAELDLVCSGEIPRVVTACSETAFAAADLNSTDGCAKADPGLTAASADCIDCYLEESRCTLEHCLLECLLGGGLESCAMCRASQCGTAFTTCSGLPAP